MTDGSLRARADEVRDYFRRPGTVSTWWDPENDAAKHFLRRSEAVFSNLIREIPRDVPVLDVGTGRGRFAILAAEVGFTEVTGVDLSEEMLSIARRRADERGVTIRFRCDEAETLASVADDSVGIVSLMEAFDHIPDTRAALQAIHRTLHPGGILIGTFVNARSLYGLLFAVYRALVGRRGMIAQTFSPRVFARHLEATGFVIERQVGIQLLNLPHTRLPLLRWLLSPFRLLGRIEAYMVGDYQGRLSGWCTSVVFAARRQ
jgi:2-polyprenyl-3-methyl-5-hydroxy-6-metoxy-1,4-benzoquinol methylase